MNNLLFTKNIGNCRQVAVLGQWGPVLGMKWSVWWFCSCNFNSFFDFTLKNYDERDKTTAFLENKGPGPMADFGSTKSALWIDTYMPPGTNFILATQSCLSIFEVFISAAIIKTSLYLPSQVLTSGPFHFLIGPQNWVFLTRVDNHFYSPYL